MKNLCAFISVIVLIFLIAACGKDNSAQKPGADHTSAVATEIEDYVPPEDVDMGVFEKLKDEFLRQLGEIPERLVADAPMGEAGRVTDLAYDPGTGLLTWTYVNLGDYNLSGDVNIADVAEVAPLANNYLNEVSEYVILTSDTPEGTYTEIGRVDFSEAKTPSQSGANFPKLFEVLLPEGAQQYIAVEPVDAAGMAGDKSNLLGGSWHVETVDSAGDVGRFTSIALDSSDNPHISYFDWTNDDLKYAYYR